ncbi:MAG: ribosomal protein S18-alanine N-acetyltransferase [Clostridia bacterium]|nr:ribosomal protein S18-alanine N-acetyltransferase [Clostridia bacterium]
MVDLCFQNLLPKFCDQVAAIEAASIDEPWTLNQIRGLVDDQNAVARIGVIEDKVVCYYSFYNICDEGNINNLAVLQDFKGKGIGSLLLEDMIKLAKELNISALTLEVNVNNEAAIALYIKYGFVVEGRRLKFYGGRDDALIMWKRNL